ncbi:MAG TPA: DNA-binding domain-containing protein [Burkholderiales bacterium]
MEALRTGALARFQDAFVHTLMDPGALPDASVAALVAQPAFDVYRNTVMKGCIDALQANYPAVARLVGDEWFRAAAAIYVRESLPADPTLLRYGASFTDFLARFAPAAELPYLPGVARLDRSWTEAHTAPDETAIGPADIARLAPAALARAVLHPHAAARWAWFEDAPIYTIWSRNRAAAVPAPGIDWRAEGALLVRPRDAVEWIALDAAGAAFLDACAAGMPAPRAASAALEARDDADLTQLMCTLLAAGAFGRMSFIDDPISREENR